MLSVSDCFWSFLLNWSPFSQTLWSSAYTSSAHVRYWGWGGGFSRCPLRSTELSPICPPLNICRGSAGGHSGLLQLFVRRWAPKEPVLGTHLPAAFPLSPVGNWHIPSLIITATWHVYSQRWADPHRRHILALGVSARCPFEASLRLRWLKIPSCYIFLGQ